MAYFEYLWTEDDGGNVQHIAPHGLTPEDFEFVFENCEDEAISNATGLPIRFGYTADGRYIVVIFKWLDAEEILVMPVTAYETPERRR